MKIVHHIHNITTDCNLWHFDKWNVCNLTLKGVNCPKCLKSIAGNTEYKPKQRKLAQDRLNSQ